VLLTKEKEKSKKEKSNQKKKASCVHTGKDSGE
jgi:hypothetical protein